VRRDRNMREEMGVVKRDVLWNAAEVTGKERVEGMLKEVRMKVRKVMRDEG